jgi:hypothetical protein
MAWSASALFTQFMLNPGMRAVNAATAPTTFTSLTADTVKAALYDNDITPDKDAAVASTGFNTGQWAISGNEVTDATNWVSGGRAIGNDAFTAVANAVMYDADDLAGGGTLTLTNAFGCLVYDDTITGGTVVDQGVCYNYFGGGQSVTAGTFTIVWHANGIFRVTV